MSSYNQVFGGQNINPADLSYISYDLTDDLVLVWPFQATDDSDVIAAKVDINATVAGKTVKMPDTTVVSVGSDVLFNNAGTESFTVIDNLGYTIIEIAPGEQYYLYLIDNSTAAGSWRITLFGSSTSPLAASALAGFGLQANASRLDQNLATLVLNSDYGFTANDRASVARNNSGSVTWDFDAAATLANGWFVYVINGGSGAITLDPNSTETIDGQATKTINPGESCIVFSDGQNLWTLGYGRAVVSTVTGTSVNLAGSGTTTLDAAQVAAQVQNFTGALTGNRIIEYGTGVGYWFVYNNTSGAYSCTFRVNNVDPGVVIPQGTFSILRSDGTTMSVAFTATTGTVTQIDTAAGELTGGPITSTGTIGLANTAVTPGSYGAADKTLTATVDAKGRLTALAQVAISIVISQIQAFTSAALRALVSDPTGTGSLVFGTGPTLSGAQLGNSSVATTQAAGDDSTKLATTEYVDAAVAAIMNQLFDTGDFLHTSKSTARTGWVFATGSIGSASSGATTRANADTADLFSHLWDTYSDVLCPVSGGRGLNAAADFAANKTLTMLDARGMMLAAAENMGGANRGNLGTNSSAGGFSGTASLGASAGAKDHTPIIDEMASHDHTGRNGIGSTTPSTGGGAVVGTSPSNTGLTGGGSAFNITQPTLICNILIKL